MFKVHCRRFGSGPLPSEPIRSIPTEGETCCYTSGARRVGSDLRSEPIWCLRSEEWKYFSAVCKAGRFGYPIRTELVSSTRRLCALVRIRCEAGRIAPFHPIRTESELCQNHPMLCFFEERSRSGSDPIREVKPISKFQVSGSACVHGNGHNFQTVSPF